jgi:uncharacterized protein YbjT (DUF2867 family)
MNDSPPGQARLVIVGATGMVGGYALRYALSQPAVGLVTAVGRRAIGVSHPKLKEVVHRDFADCSALADALSGEDAAIFCLGAYTGVVSDAELRKVTVDYTIAFARFRRYKGEAENALLAMGFPRVAVFRPAYIYPVEPRKEPNFGYRLLRAIYPAFRVLLPNQVIRADDLARAMVDVAVRRTGDPEGLILENRDIRIMAE